jgi:hypothetical protein
MGNASCRWKVHVWDFPNFWPRPSTGPIWVFNPNLRPLNLEWDLKSVRSHMQALILYKTHCLYTNVGQIYKVMMGMHHNLKISQFNNESCVKFVIS